MDEREKIRLRIHHWIEHNQEHSAEFREWAVKAGKLAGKGVEDEIMAAADQLTRANQRLEEALRKLEGGGRRGGEHVSG